MCLCLCAMERPSKTCPARTRVHAHSCLVCVSCIDTEQVASVQQHRRGPARGSNSEGGRVRSEDQSDEHVLQSCVTILST